MRKATPEVPLESLLLRTGANATRDITSDSVAIQMIRGAE